MTPLIQAPRIVNKGDLAAVANRLNALSEMRVTVRVEGTPVSGVVRIDGNRASIDLDLSGLTINGYSPDNADTLSKLDEDNDGTLTYDGQRIGASGLTQQEMTWASSMVVSLTGDKVRKINLAGNTAITVTDLAAARECYLLLFGGASDYTLTWQSGMRWPESGDVGPASIKAGTLMTVHIYSSGAASTDLIAMRNGGF